MDVELLRAKHLVKLQTMRGLWILFIQQQLRWYLQSKSSYRPFFRELLMRHKAPRCWMQRKCFTALYLVDIHFHDGKTFLSKQNRYHDEHQLTGIVDRDNLCSLWQQDLKKTLILQRMSKASFYKEEEIVLRPSSWLSSQSSATRIVLSPLVLILNDIALSLFDRPA